MQKIFSSVAVIVLLALGLSANAQQKLTLKDAIEIALKNSYDIKLVENNRSISKNNNDYGVAGA